MNVFDIHRQVVGDYASYIQSFINISDPGIRAKVHQDLGEGKLWPDPLLQFNPAYEIVGKVDDIAKQGLLHADLADVFKGYSLYRHQVEAFRLGTTGKDFIVTSGTGSGKSLTYIGSIFHHLLANPDAAGVTAIVVYPMNALINSQTNEFKRYKANYEAATGKDFPITFGQYTGQEDESQRLKMRQSPPKVLLTNFMMLELLLTRVQERSIRDAIYENLRYLVFDELHTYRGRQGADVALLIRRIKAQCKQPVTCIGTSATMVSVGSLASQREQVARVATTIFGRTFAPEQIINETLARSLDQTGAGPSREVLAEAIRAGIDAAGAAEQLRVHPVAVWLENQVALEEREGQLVRRKPRRIGDTISDLAAASGVALEQCRDCLVGLLHWISVVNVQLQAAGVRYAILPFKLHQFISQTGSVYTTLDQDEARFITLEPGIYKADEPGNKPIFPNVFSRASGHPFLCVTRVAGRLEPREFRETTEDDPQAEDGYLIVGSEVWDPAVDLESLPDAWFKINKSGRVPDGKKAKFFPVKVYFDEHGNCSETAPMKWWGWFMRAPLLFDPTGGMFFDPKTYEGSKLTKLGSEGRSTSTTITAFSILNRLRDAAYHPRDQKVLSFTDNRQDAALQSGHFNDFVQVVHLRAGIRKALEAAPGNVLTYATIGEAVFNALALQFTEFANRSDEPGLATVRREYELTFQNFLFYRAIADLKRSWRIVLPNLEQCGLLRIDYRNLDEVAAEEAFWIDLAILRDLEPSARRELIATVLDFYRLEYALHSENFLAPSIIKENEKHFREKLKAPWTLDRDEDLRDPCVIRYERLAKTAKLASQSMGPASALGKYLKQFVRDRGLDQTAMQGEHYRDFVLRLMDKLESADYLHRMTARSQDQVEVPVFRLKVDKLLWRLGDGETVKADVIKRRAYKDIAPSPNVFFRDMYRREFANGKRLRAEDHTGQLDTASRKDREERFRAEWVKEDGKTPDEDKIRRESISALFCSPTMELGIDIGGLSVVHMRNAPPNPANYAQRSGRAGRSGQGALVFTYCSSYSPHDRHYFSHQAELVAGTVQAPRLDLCNRELLLTHLNALAISEVGLPGLEAQIGRPATLLSLIDKDGAGMPLAKSVRAGLAIPPAAFARLKATFKRVIKDYETELLLRGSAWYTDDWIDQNLAGLADHLDAALGRWRNLHQSARSILSKATQGIDSGTLAVSSEDYKRLKRMQDQATRQLNLLENDLGSRSTELSEFYPYRYLASEAFLPGYNFTRLPLRIFVPTGTASGDFISRPRYIALREFGPLNVIYHNGRKYRVSQLVVQDAASGLSEAKISTKAGYFLTGVQKDLEICPFTGVSLADGANRQNLTDLLEMTESRADEVDRISCEEEERVSKGFQIQTYFSVDGGSFDRVRKASVKVGDSGLLSLRYIPAARLVHVNTAWRAARTDGFPLGLTTGFWRSAMPDPDDQVNESFRLVQLWTSNLADALYIEPTQPLGLEPAGVITLQHALKRAIESVFQVEPSEIGVVTIGDPKSPNILLYEAAEGSLGILSQFADDVGTFHRVVEEAKALCRFDDPEYLAPASYDDLLSYYNQRDHKIIDRHTIKDALEKLRASQIELQSNPAFRNYEEHYQALLAALDPNSSTERKFIDFLHEHGLRLPDKAQMKVEGIYVQPDFYYEPRIHVFCDGTPHDEPEVKAADALKRQALIARGDEVWVYYYKDDLAAKVAQRPDIFRKVR
jgi:superfamily II DNA/RNA helicase